MLFNLFDFLTEGPSTSADDGEFEGNLVRKHEWESTTKKASNRSVFNLIRKFNKAISINLVFFIICDGVRQKDPYLHPVKIELMASPIGF